MRLNGNQHARRLDGQRSGDDAFFRSASRWALLTEDEEITLAREVQRWVALRDAGRQLTREEQRDLVRGKRARDRLVNCNVRFVAMMARSMVWGKRQKGLLEYEDVLQEGFAGLCKAAERFDGSRGVRFCTYAKWWIRQAMLRAIYTQGHMMRLPEQLAQCYGKLPRVRLELEERLGRAATAVELAEALGIKPEALRLMVSRGAHPMSLESSSFDDGSGAKLYECVSEDPAFAVDDRNLCEEVSGGESVLTLMRLLGDEEQELLRLHYGLNGEEPLSHAQLAKRLGVSRSKVQKDLVKATGRLSALARPEAGTRRGPLPRYGTPALQCAA